MKNIRSKQVANGYKIPINCLKLSFVKLWAEVGSAVYCQIQYRDPVRYVMGSIEHDRRGVGGYDSQWLSPRYMLLADVMLSSEKHVLPDILCAYFIVKCNIERGQDLAANAKKYLRSDVNVHFTCKQKISA